MGTITLQTATAVGAGTNTGAFGSNPSRVYQCTLTGTGAVSCSVNIEVSADSSTWLVLGTIALTGASPQTDAFASFAQWAYVRANTTAIAGTGATAVTSIQI